MAKNIEYNIVKNVGVIPSEGDGWNKEVNIIDWGKGEKYDIRPWSEDHEKMGKGITLTEDEIVGLYNILKTVVEGDSLDFKKKDKE